MSPRPTYYSVFSTTGATKTFAFSPQQIPVMADIDRFIKVRDITGKCPVPFHALTNAGVAKLDGKDLSLFAHRYSNSISSKSTYDDMKTALLVPSESDRSNAVTNSQLRTTANRLHQIHGDHYAAPFIHWMSWAEFIHRQDAGVQERFMNDRVPFHLNHFFTMICENPIFAQHRHMLANSVALGENERTSSVLDDLQRSVECLKRAIEHILTIASDIDTRLRAQRLRLEGAREVLIDSAVALHPQDTGMSTALLAGVPNLDDLEHAEVINQ